MLHTIKNDYLTVTISQDGAQLQSILGTDGTEYLWQGDPKYWSDRALNLFPYVARLNQGSYYLDGQMYHMDIHGIAPYRCFQAERHSDTEIDFILSADPATLAAYPRNFRFCVRYTLSGDTLHIAFLVENRDEKTMYFGLGGHPGFYVPLASGLDFTDYQVRFHTPCQPLRIGFTPDCFVSGEDTPFPLEDGCILKLEHSLFDQDAIVLKHMSHCLTLESPGDPHGVTVSFPQMDYVGFWHSPKTDAPYVCVEPWCSLPAAAGKITVFEEQADLIHLAPGNTYCNRWFIRIHSC